MIQRLRLTIRCNNHASHITSHEGSSLRPPPLSKTSQAPTDTDLYRPLPPTLPTRHALEPQATIAARNSAVFYQYAAYPYFFVTGVNSQPPAIHAHYSTKPLKH